MSQPVDIRIGNQTAFSARTPLEPFEFALANGFDAFEFFPDRGFDGSGGWDEHNISSSSRNNIQQSARKAGLQLTVHAPLAYDPLKNHLDGRLYSTVAFAHDIGARLVNLHLDMSHGAEAITELLHPALELTAEAGLQLALENTVFTSPEDFNRFFETLQERGDHPVDHAGMCFDLGHANACAATRNDYCGFLDRLDEHVPLIHLHLHENCGDRDSHLTLFTGPSRDNPAGLLGLLDRLAVRGFSGCAILEQWPEPSLLLVEARNRLRQLIDQHFERTPN
jgi:sugar phosphate isomerase/epimerase